MDSNKNSDCNGNSNKINIGVKDSLTSEHDDITVYWDDVLIVEVRHATVKLLSVIYGRLDRRALRVGKPISSSARSQAFYSSIVCTSTI